MLTMKITDLKLSFYIILSELTYFMLVSSDFYLDDGFGQL